MQILFFDTLPFFQYAHKNATTLCAQQMHLIFRSGVLKQMDYYRTANKRYGNFFIEGIDDGYLGAKQIIIFNLYKCAAMYLRNNRRVFFTYT
jgi:hypothetical protein